MPHIYKNIDTGELRALVAEPCGLKRFTWGLGGNLWTGDPMKWDWWCYIPNREYMRAYEIYIWSECHKQYVGPV